jgi:hypothetical protein
MCEGVWRNRTGQRVVITQCEPVGGQQWTDGFELYSDDGKYYQSQREDSQDLVAFVGLLPDSSQRAPVSRPAETESTTAVAGGVSDDPGRIIYELEERLAAETKRTEQAQRYISDANEAINEKAAEIERLRAEWQTEFFSAQQLRSENDRLRAEIERVRDELRGYAAETHRQLRVLEADGTAMDHHCEGMKAAFLATIKVLAGVRA